ncbi:hypothetical protein M8C21_001599 [Ambrosia artemisiifolia]|uniref:Zinc finger A20 and AN1 domain-containing stress-associated protein 8 n=1 Tax=Ambrosia artemisiifolia TaxID=4212 RepID=A0AAD5CC39_AMBAR|nr:hypothetical protein M8C21_001599 [Ambrosia artemisiifolia]
MEKNETGCQTAPEAPTLCINNCGFFGTPSTMNMCSKCHKDMILQQEQVKLAASSSFNTILNGNNITSQSSIALSVSPVPEVALLAQTSSIPQAQAESGDKPNPGQGPSRCTTCRKRVGLTSFICRCGNVFCSVHRYSDKHDCQFDYRTTAKDAIAKANPVVKAEKLDKI